MEATAGAERVLYLYGVAPRGQRLPATEGLVIEAVPFSDLAAVVEPVPAAEFSSEVLEEKLQRVEWIAPLARKHAAVLEEAMRHGPVVPARLCTLFSSARAVANLLAENEQRFQDSLRWLDGRQEWGIKVFCDEAELRSTLGPTDPDVQALEAAAATTGPGHAYVLRKKRDARIAEVVSAWIDEVVEDVVDVLGSLAVESRVRALRSDAAMGRTEVMVLNAAFLVDVAACDGLRTEVAELVSRRGAEGFAFELTGPWPPYSFCDDDSGSDVAADESALEEVR